MKRPLVSILIPAHNAQEWIAQSLQSALSQTWPRKEIIVVDDGSRDRTAEVARRFESKELKVVSIENSGQSAAVNEAYRHCQGDYIQELDSDDLISPDKIERQLAALKDGESKRILLSSPWAHFHYRPRRARFVPTALWQDLSPVEWLLRKMGQKLHMQNATWLMSREVAEAAGPWDETLHYDQDGEYFCRVLLASEGTRFVPEGKVFYRLAGSGSVSYIGKSDKKRDSLLRSIKLHIQYLRSLENSERVNKSCLIFLQNKCIDFYPERPDLVAALQAAAAELGGHLTAPRLRWKYAWMKPLVGWKLANRAQMALPGLKDSVIKAWDRTMFEVETRENSKRRLDRPLVN